MSNFVPKSDIRCQFSQAMSKMYQAEVPLYKDLMDLVADVNVKTLGENPDLKQQLINTGELERIDLERHGAIRLGLPSELATIRRLFAVMGMMPVGYYDLAPAGVPVHATAFRAMDSDELMASPFRVFCSLLRDELIAEPLRSQALETLHKRNIFTDEVIALIEKAEKDGGLNQEDADKFVVEATKTFQWHKTSPVTKEFYEELAKQHRLIADVVGFYGPHINHLTPRTLDIDAAQDEMIKRNISAKEIIEGPPRRNCPIFLRQTSFKALSESIEFAGSSEGKHTARFGEIEQRGIALTAKGRALYDELLDKAKSGLTETPEANPATYYKALEASFAVFPDSYNEIYEQDLGYFYYQKLTDKALTAEDLQNPKQLVKDGILAIEPIVYEDFLPVSAAGIFQSNLGDDARDGYANNPNQAQFEQALGAKVCDMNELYQAMMDKSLQACLN